MKAKKSWFQRIAEWIETKKAIKSEPILPQEYISAVTRLAKKRTNQRFLNDTNEHAEFVFWLIIRSCRLGEEILIYSKALKFPFYRRILRAACLFDPGIVFKILLDDEEGIEEIKKLPENVQRQIECRIASVSDGAHMVVTSTAFRIEAKDYHDELFVVCNFYEPDIAENLRKRFNRIWENAVPFPAD